MRRHWRTARPPRWHMACGVAKGARRQRRSTSEVRDPQHIRPREHLLGRTACSEPRRCSVDSQALMRVFVVRCGVHLVISAQMYEQVLRDDDRLYLP